jgi:hypothetical protein
MGWGDATANSFTGQLYRRSRQNDMLTLPEFATVDLLVQVPNQDE